MNGKQIREIFNNHIEKDQGKSTIPWDELSEARKRVWDLAAKDISEALDRLERDEVPPAAQRYAYKGGPRKALISRGFGAGWSTWNTDYRHEFLFDPELIAAVEAFEGSGDKQRDRDSMQEHLGLIGRGMKQSLRPGSPLANFEERMKLEYGDGEDGFHAYYGGADDLEVREIDGQFMVDEYDGSESITLRGQDDGWI